MVVGMAVGVSVGECVGILDGLSDGDWLVNADGMSEGPSLR
jgi:hypothetical protein